MKSIDKTGPPGKKTTWIYQHRVLPWMVWIFQVFEARLEAIERLTIMPKCFSSGRLYIVGTKLQLLLSSLVEEYKITKVGQHLTLRDNKDEKVRRDRVYLEADMGCFG